MKKSIAFIVVAVFVLMLAGPALHAADKYFDVTPSTADIDGGTANWADAQWKTAADGTSGGTWVANDTAFFNSIIGTPTTTTITLSGPQTATALNFNADGYTLTGGTISLAGTGSSNWFNMNADGAIASAIGHLRFKGSGEATISGGGTISGRGVVGDGETGLTTVRQTAGAVTIGSDWLMVGGNGVANSQGHYIMDDGTLTINKGIYLGWKGNGSVGTFTQNGGTVTTQDSSQALKIGIEGGTGYYYLNGGTLNSNFGSSAGGPFSGGFIFGGGTFKAAVAFNTNTQPNITTSIADGATALIDTNDQTVTWSTALTGAAANGLSKTGEGTLLLSGDNTFAGGVTADRGTIRAGSSTAFGAGTVATTGSGSYSGAIDLNGYSFDNNFSIGEKSAGPPWGGDPLGTLKNDNTSSASVINGNVSIGGENYVGGAGDITINGLVSGNDSFSIYAFFKRGTGTWTFANTANTFDGFYYLYEGTTEVASLGNLNEASSLGRPTTSDKNRVSFGWNGGGGGTLRFVGAAASSSDRVFVLQGATAAASNTIEASGATAADTLTLTGGLSAGLAGDYTLALGGDNTGDNEYAGVIANGSGTVGLAKQGAGKWILSGANTYSGATTVEAGTLLVDGSLASAVTVAEGATLGGSGTLSGGLTMNSGSTLSPGNSPGTLTVAGDLSLDGADLVVDIWGATAGTEYDQIEITSGGELILASNPGITVDLGGSFDPAVSSSFAIVSGIESWTGNWGDLTVVNAPSTWTSSGKSFEIEQGSVMLTVIPEPNTIGMLLVIGAAALIHRMRMS